MFYLNEREVEIVSQNVDDDFIQVTEAYYLDNEDQLNDNELEELESKYQRRLTQNHYSNLVDYTHEMLSNR